MVRKIHLYEDVEYIGSRVSNQAPTEKNVQKRTRRLESSDKSSKGEMSKSWINTVKKELLAVCVLLKVLNVDLFV